MGVMPETVTTEELLGRWWRAESAMNTYPTDTLAWLLARDRADEAREAYQARLDAIADAKHLVRC